MALADTKNAVGAVSRMLRDRLMSSGVVSNVTIGKPEPPKTVTNPRLNLFLYEVGFDGSLKNISLDDGQPAPLWLALKYLLTAFDVDGESDSIGSHELLGQGAQVLQDLNFFPLTGLSADTVKALKDNPDLLKLTFDDASHELLSKLMQGTDEKYRCSIAFQVRPVMIASAQPPAYSLLVGVDYTNNTIIGEKGIKIPILPSMGPDLTSVSPDKIEVGATLTVQGTDLNLKGLAVTLGSLTFPVTAQQPDQLQFTVGAALGSGTTLSAGTLPLAVVQKLPSGRLRPSNLLTVDVMPVVTAATPSGLATVGGNVFGFVDVTGNLLGLPSDDVFLAFFKNGKVVRMTDDIVPPVGPPPPPQTGLRFRVTAENAIPPGTYTMILRVNGQQAPNSPQVIWT